MFVYGAPLQPAGCGHDIAVGLPLERRSSPSPLRPVVGHERADVPVLDERIVERGPPD